MSTGQVDMTEDSQDAFGGSSW